MSREPEEIRRAVRDHYARLATAFGEGGARSSCCGGPQAASGGCCGSLSPSVETPGSLLDGIASLSLGCGDPVTLAGLQPGETVLDLGSGAGIDCLFAAQRVGESGCVIGVDMTPEMIERATANAVKLGLSNVEFRLGQIEALPVDDQTVDVVISNCVVNLAPDKLAVFREAFRVLKPGGRVSISDIVAEGVFGSEWTSRLDAWATCISGAIDPQEYIALMEEAGFVDIEIVDRAGYDSVLSCCGAASPRVFSAQITARKLALHPDDTI